MNNYKYGITPAELKEARKYIINDIIHDNFVENAIMNMTLNMYFYYIHGCILGACDPTTGCITSPYGPWASSERNLDMRNLTPVAVAKLWTDGRGLFSEHFNSNTETHFGDWKNIGPHEQNQWYHEDRLDDPEWFKECVSCIGHAGHPTELLTCGNFNPIYHSDGAWTLEFGTFSRSDYYTLKGYLFLKKRGVPVYIYGAHTYLTPKQQKTLLSCGFLRYYDGYNGYKLSDVDLYKLLDGCRNEEEKLGLYKHLF